MDNQDNTRQTHSGMPAVDLGPLSWVVDSLREILHGTRENLLQFSSEVAAASGSHLTTLDTTALRVATQKLHEAVGVLDLVERPAAAHMVGAMERAVQRFVNQPELCTPQAVDMINQAGASVLDYLTSVLKGHPDQSVGLFPAYHNVAQLAGFDRIHPADLWHQPWGWLEVQHVAAVAAPTAQESEASFFAGVLKVFQSGGAEGVAVLARRAHQVWQSSVRDEERVFWQLATGFLQVLAAGALAFDDHVKRLLSKIAVQYDALKQGSSEVSERLAQDLLFFNALGSQSLPPEAAPVASAIVQRYGLQQTVVSHYDHLLYGRVDPALRERLRSEVATFKTLWSDVAAGDVNKINGLSAQAERLTQSLDALWPDAQVFSKALQSAVRKVHQSGQAPHDDVAMEMATSLLFLEATLEEFQADTTQVRERAATLAQRLESVQRGEQIAPLTDWMESLYGQLNSRESLAHVVKESRSSVGEVEQALDDFFRHPHKVEQAQESIAKLGKISSILMMLGCDDASVAVDRMADQVKQLVTAASTSSSIDDSHSQDNVLRLGNSLGALAFMLEMMEYQPEQAKAQFYFDAQQQVLVHRKGAASAPMAMGEPTAGVVTSAVPTDSDHHAAAQPTRPVAHPSGAPTAAITPAPDPLDDGIVDVLPEEEDLREIFLEEAAEVIGNAHAAITALQNNATDLAQLTNLRRAFHTLKGSGRMVGLASFGEAAWELERTLNGWLADGKPATDGLLKLASNALEALSQWRDSIAAKAQTQWHHRYFKQPAADMHEHGTYLAIALPQAGLSTEVPTPALHDEKPLAVAAPTHPAGLADALLAPTHVSAGAPSAQMPVALASTVAHASPPPVAPDTHFPLLSESQFATDTAERFAGPSTQTYTEPARAPMAPPDILFDELFGPDAAVSPVAKTAALPFADHASALAADEMVFAPTELPPVSVLFAPEPAPHSPETLQDMVWGSKEPHAMDSADVALDFSHLPLNEPNAIAEQEGTGDPLDTLMRDTLLQHTQLPDEAEGLGVDTPAQLAQAIATVRVADDAHNTVDVFAAPLASQSASPQPSPFPAESSAGYAQEEPDVFAPEGDSGVFSDVVFESPHANEHPHPATDTEVFAQAPTAESQPPVAQEQGDAVALFAPSTHADLPKTRDMHAPQAPMPPPVVHDGAWSEIAAIDAAADAQHVHPHAATAATAAPADKADTTPGVTSPAAADPTVLGMLVNTAPQLSVLQDMIDGLPEDEIKRVGDLRIPLALFNAYLNEADTWSRQLVHELGEWALEFDKPAPESANHLAHSLAGSSATVGMGSLASTARGIEHALDHLQNRTAKAIEAQVLVRAAEQVRQALHQFAAGIARPLDMGVLHRLAAIVDNTSCDEEDAALAQAEPTTHGPEESPRFADLVPAAYPHHVFAEPASADAPAVAAHAQAAASETDAAQTAFVEPLCDPTSGEADEIALFAEASDGLLVQGHDPVREPAENFGVTQVMDEAALLPHAPAPEPTEPSQRSPEAPVAQTSTEPQPWAASAAPVLPTAVAVLPQPVSAGIHDTLDPELFDIFREEAEVLMPQLSAAMRQWTARPDNQGARKEVMRLLHTLKGGARLAGAMQWGNMAHDMESAIGELGADLQAAQQIEPLQAMLDDMDGHFQQLVRGGAAAQPTAYSPAFAAPPSAQAPVPRTATAEAAISLAQPTQPVFASGSETQTVAPSADAPTPPTNKLAVAMPVATNLVAQQAVLQQQVRVRSNILDRMLGQTGEVMTSRARLEGEVSQLRQAVSDMDGSLARLRTQLRDMELQAESQMQSRLAQAPDAARNFDPLEFDRFTRVQELTRMMAESVNDVATVQRNMMRTVQSTEDNLTAQARQTKDLQSDLLRTRMVEFESLSERLYRVVRQASKEIGKQVKLDIVGGSIEMDRSVIERIAPPFEHLLRNAVVHGVESPEQRIAQGKNPVGEINISLRQEGNDVAIAVRDDGRGLDVLRIRNKAVAQGLLASGASVSDEEATQLIFQSGLSTVDDVSALAGRGVGMDVVRSEVNALGGRIEVKTHQNLGTEFTLVLPLTTAVTQVVELRAGDMHFGVPSHLIEAVRRATAKEIQQAYNTKTYAVDGEELPFYWAGAMLQSSRRSEDMAAKRQVVVVLRSAAQRIVMHINAVAGNHEVVVKNIGPQLVRMPGLSGITILPDGRLLFIYNPVALSFVYGEQIRAFSADHADPAVLGGERHEAVTLPAVEGARPLVLVVDDSITVRRVTERLLKREGYRVALAADGMAALRELAIEKPLVVLSDIEMPQMDGFDLLRNIRSDAHLKDLPVIMITSRTADKHREHAMQLGATDFLGKPYPEEQLLDMVRNHATVAA